MNKFFGIALIVAVLLAMAEATIIKLSFGFRDNIILASSTNLEPACVKEEDEKDFYSFPFLQNLQLAINLCS